MASLNRRRQFLLWVVAAFSAVAVLLAVVAAERRPRNERHALYVIGIPEKGSALFHGEKRCAICHAANGWGGRIAPDFARIPMGRPAMAWLAAGLWNHSPGMWRQMGGAKPPDLSQEEMADILAYLYQAASVDPPGDRAAGERVFSAKGCVRCHAPEAAGGHGAPDLLHASSSRDAAAWMRSMWNHAQSMVEPVTRELGHWPQFQGEEMNNLIAYVSGSSRADASRRAGDPPGLRSGPERGWQAFQSKCMQCHSVGGKGGRSGPELGPDRALPNHTAEFAAVLWNHAPAMVEQGRTSATPIPTMEGSEIQDILQFLISLRYYEPSGSPFLGEKVFGERGCARCHGAKAEGTHEAPPLRAGQEAFTTVSLASALWRHGPAMKARSEELGISWPTLEPGDIGDLISFLNDAGRQ